MPSSTWVQSQDAALSSEQLLQLAMRGEGARALAAAEHRVADASERHGTSSGDYAAALFLLSEVCLALNLVQRGIGELRKATEIRTSKPEDERNRLTYLMNLGDYLTLAGQLEEALEVQQRSLDGRRAFYGEDHPGFGFGLTSWAGAAISLGRYKDAQRAAATAMGIYQRHGHAHFTRAIGFVMLSAAGAGERVRFSELSADAAAEVLATLTGRDVAAKASLIAQCIDWVSEAVGAGASEQLADAWSVVQGLAMREQDYVTAATSMERLLPIAESLGNAIWALDAELGLALALDRQGDHPRARLQYERVVARARGMSGASRARALRNAGLYLSGGHDPAAGLKLLEEAATIAGEEGDRSKVALGIQLQHRGESERARDNLRAALRALDAAHPDAMCAASHLKALERGEGCGCGAPSDEFDQQMARLIRERLPAELIRSVTVQEGETSIEVNRTLTDAEARQVADAVELVRAEMRQRVQKLYG